MTKQPVLWVLVADGAQARVVVPDAVEGRFRTLVSLGHIPHTREGLHVHDEAHTTHVKGFAVDVGARLNEEARKGAFDQLVLVAPGHVLHDVREKLNKATAALVAGSAQHDYTKLNDHDLSPHLAQWWLAPAEAV